MSARSAAGTKGRLGPRIAAAAALLAAGVLLLAVALPELARRFLERTASAAFPGVVTIGGLRLGWTSGALLADDVAVWAIDAPNAPLLHVKQLSLRLELAALRRHELHVVEVVLADPSLHVERLADGRFSLQDLAPRAEPPTARPASEAAPAPWHVRVDSVRLIGGRVRFRDLSVEGSASLPISIERFDLEGVSLREGPLPEPARLTIEARLGEAPMRLAIEANELLPRLAFDARLELTGFRLDGSAIAGALAGIERVRGFLDASLHHVYATDDVSRIDGAISLREVAAELPGSNEPVLAWKRLDAEVERLDLRARDARLARVAVSDARIAVAPGDENPLPVLAARSAAATTEAPDVTAPPPTRWSWTLARLDVDGARIALRGGTAKPLDVAASLHARAVAGAPSRPFPLELEAEGAGGKLTLRGDAQIDPPAYHGALRASTIDVARGLAAAGGRGGSLATWLRGGRLDADLTLDLEGGATPWSARGELAAADVALQRDPAPGEPGLVAKCARLEAELRELETPALAAGGGDSAERAWLARGVLRSTGCSVADFEPSRESEFGVAWQRLEASVTEARVPMTVETGTTPDAARAATHLEVADLEVAAPWLRLTRTEHGLVLPALPSAGPEAEPAPTPELEAGPVHLVGGSVRFVDQTVTPYYDAELSDVALAARLLAWRGPTLRDVALHARSDGAATLGLEGGGDASGLTFVVRADGLPLPPLNPYATRFGYDVQRGDADLVSSVWVGSKGLEARSWLSLQDLSVRELRPGSFEEMTGVSLGFALDVLRDGSGRIELTLPIWWNAEGFGLHAGETLSAATRQAIVGTLLLPLRKLGALVTSETEPRIEPPPPIPFAPGSADLSGDADARILSLARFLASRPGVAIDLEARSSAADGPSDESRRALGERRLAQVIGRLRERHGVSPRQVRGRTADGEAVAASPEVRVLLGGA